MVCPCSAIRPGRTPQRVFREDQPIARLPVSVRRELGGTSVPRQRLRLPPAPPRLCLCGGTGDPRARVLFTPPPPPPTNKRGGGTLVTFVSLPRRRLGAPRWRGEWGGGGGVHLLYFRIGSNGRDLPGPPPP